MGAYGDWVGEDRAASRHRRRVRRLPEIAAERLRRMLTLVRDETPASNEWRGDLSWLRAALRAARRAGVPELPQRPRITHLIGSLGPGGAERQLCNFVLIAKQRGHDVRVMLTHQPVGELGHYLHLLERGGVPVTVAGARFDQQFASSLESMPGGPAVLDRIPDECWPVFDILGELLSDRPDILHTWLDSPNLFGTIAGQLARVPLIVMSTRNVNPTHFPMLSRPYYQSAYAKLLQAPNVRIINNSNPGADDYARWLSIPRSRLSVVLNGLDVSGFHPATQEEVAAFRERLPVPFDGRVVAGVFRLAEEKQPFVYLEVLRGVIRRCPDIYGVIAGVGPLEADVREYLAAHDLQQRIVLLGRLADVRPLYGAAALKLLCSRQEGTPNVLLESQWFGCPVVSTKAGGAIDAVDDGRTGYLRDVGDINGLQDAVMSLLRDEPTRSRMAREGPGFIGARFSVERMANETLAVYGLRNGERQ